MFRRSTHILKQPTRRGAAAVELALVMPLLFTLTFAGVETGHALSMSQKLESAVRDGGRIALQDIDEELLNGVTANVKVENDIKNMLRAEGISGSQITVSILHADGPSAGQTFDLADPDNAYQLLKIEVAVPYSAVSMFPFNISAGAVLRVSMVGSRGRSTLTL